MAYLVSPDFSLIIFLWLVLEVRGSNGSAAQLYTPFFDVKSAVVLFVMYLPDASLASTLSLLSSEEDIILWIRKNNVFFVVVV